MCLKANCDMRCAASLMFLLSLVTGMAGDCLSNTDSGRCKAGWELFQDNCYYFSTHGETINTAQDICHSMDAHLVDIRSEEENAFLQSNSRVIRPWIGLNWRHEGWYWHSDRSQATYLPWYPDEPNNESGNEDCVEILTAGTWNDRDCDSRLRYICKVVQARGSCATGWRRLEDYCYKFSTETQTRARAQQQCESMGARLADIRSVEENLFIKDKISERSWIGLQRRSGAWFWNKDVNQQIDYVLWDSGEPNNKNGNEFCVEQLPEGRWNDVYCGESNVKRYICKTPADPPCEYREDCVIMEGQGFPFGPCSATCGEGTKSRVYYCTVRETGIKRFVREEAPCTVSCA